MKHPPLPVDPHSFEVLATADFIAELAAQAQDNADGKATRTLVKDRALTVVLVAMRTGATLAEHAAPGAVLVVPLKGSVSFTAADGSKRSDLDPSRSLAIGPGLRHQVAATDDAAFLLIIGSRPDAGAD